MEKKYGFKRETLPDGTIIQVLEVGDGKSEFTDVFYIGKNLAGIGISYGSGMGVGVVKPEPDDPTPMDGKNGMKWLVRFDNQASIDSMITTLLRVKNKLSTQGIN
ncbi:MAG: hypothetical protein ACRBG0_27655 [Lewinella sp.]|uniref:hypothetical protein n=1 Tax=Lewinella sp. TaxID=2004506 RepID=UPI003D6C6E97